MIRTILFDLDGTLLGMDENKFLEIYFPLLYKSFNDDSIEMKEFITNIMKAIKATTKDTAFDLVVDTFKRNYQLFANRTAQQVDDDFLRFYDFYDNEFASVKSSTRRQPFMLEAIKYLKSKGYQLILATNPIFPMSAVKARIEWAGLNIDDFMFITYQEVVHYCKPQLAYYQEILSRYSLKPEETMMVGNDVEEDMISAELGLTTYLVKDCMISRNNLESEVKNQGSSEDFLKFVKEHL